FLSIRSCSYLLPSFFFFSSVFFTPPSTPVIYTLSLHDALPISSDGSTFSPPVIIISLRRSTIYISPSSSIFAKSPVKKKIDEDRSEEHTSELQSRFDLVCRLLLEKKKHYSDQVNSNIT